VLAQAGLGFDAALARVLRAQPSRELGDELRRYQSELLAGVGRVECLRRMATRVGHPALSSVVAALAQAEEVGSGLSEVLRPLADDVRARRRENALARAEALPEKLVFPLMIGFLPGLMVWTLGPAIHQLVEVLSAIMAAR
jgi:tight adherence protein C